MSKINLITHRSDASACKWIRAFLLSSGIAIRSHFRGWLINRERVLQMPTISNVWATRERYSQIYRGRARVSRNRTEWKRNATSPFCVSLVSLRSSGAQWKYEPSAQAYDAVAQMHPSTMQRSVTMFWGFPRSGREKEKKFVANSDE